jgi:hypothetical protein|tara:strand:- start:9266 stop:9550 length:285 start_codon:yes stop_codon:yes gene_type:complete
MAGNIFSVVTPIVAATLGGLLLGKFLSAATRKDAQDDLLATVDTEPTEKNMLLRSILMRPAVNEELNYLYGAAPAVTISNMTNMIVGTPLPWMD